jgi:hypothetical protein
MQTTTASQKSSWRATDAGKIPSLKRFDWKTFQNPAQSPAAAATAAVCSSLFRLAAELRRRHVCTEDMGTHTPQARPKPNACSGNVRPCYWGRTAGDCSGLKPSRPSSAPPPPPPQQQRQTRTRWTPAPTPPLPPFSTCVPFRQLIH